MRLRGRNQEPSASLCLSQAPIQAWDWAGWATSRPSPWRKCRGTKNLSHQHK